jgi:hypothetical protein
MLSETSYNDLKKYRGGFYTGPSITMEIREFRDQGYIVAVSRELREHPGSFCMNSTKWELTHKGEDALSEFEKAHRKEAEDKRQRRFQNQVSVAQVLVPLVTFVLGLVVEHYAGLVSGLAEFLGRWVK